MTLEEHIKRYDDRAKSIRNAIVEKKESQEVVELLRELKGYREARQELEDRHAVGTLDLIDSYIEEVNADE